MAAVWVVYTKAEVIDGCHCGCQGDPEVEIVAVLSDGSPLLAQYRADNRYTVTAREIQ